MLMRSSTYTGEDFLVSRSFPEVASIGILCSRSLHVNEDNVQEHDSAAKSLTAPWLPGYSYLHDEIRLYLGCAERVSGNSREYKYRDPHFYRRRVQYPSYSCHIGYTTIGIHLGPERDHSWLLFIPSVHQLLPLIDGGS